MQVAVYYNNKDIRIEERPTPKISSRELLVKMETSGICGSDVMEWYRIKKAPRILGHEIAGTIASVGDDVRQYSVGDRVFVSHHVPCNTCHYCLNGHHTACDTLRSTNFDPGGFAEYIRIPEINIDRGIFVLPDEVSFADGTLVEPLACVVRGQRIANVKPGESVLVIGSGMSGLIHIQLARALGAGRIFASDISDYRLAAAKRFGADVTLDAKEDLPSVIRKQNNGRLVDLVITCAGAVSAITQSIASVARGGTILLFAPTEPGVTVPVDMNALWTDAVTLTTSYGASPEDIATAIELIRARRINAQDMITHQFPLQEAAEGFRLVAEAKDSIKVILTS